MEEYVFGQGNFTIIKGKTKKEILKQCKGKKTKIYKPTSEELLRFALERTSIDIVYGLESINPRDSVHYVRGGLDQVTAKIAASKGKIIGFSYSELINSKDRAKIMARMKLNMKLCKKYKVKTVFASFGKEKRSKKDIEALMKVINHN